MKRLIATLAIAIFIALLMPPISRSQKEPLQSNQQPMSKIEGAKLVNLKDTEMGLPKSALPGVKFITYSQWKDMQEIPKTGLYLVNMSSIPRELPGRLKEEGYTLKADGTLVDRSGNAVAIFTSTQYSQLQVEQKTGSLRGTHRSINSFAGTVSYAEPYAFRCVATSGWNVYHGGFCRDYVAQTYGDAYGFDEFGRCSRTSPHTRVESIETRAEKGTARDRDSCRACDAESSRVTLELGCFWPSRGSSTSFHFVNFFDLGIRYTRAWTWTS